MTKKKLRRILFVIMWVVILITTVWATAESHRLNKNIIIAVEVLNTNVSFKHGSQYVRIRAKDESGMIYIKEYRSSTTNYITGNDYYWRVQNYETLGQLGNWAAIAFLMSIIGICICISFIVRLICYLIKDNYDKLEDE